MRNEFPPDITRPDVGTILVSPWIVETPERQNAAIAATLREWERQPWPRGFLALHCFASSDGATVLNYAQWSGDEAHLDFVRSARPHLVRGIDEAVPGIGRPGVTRFRLYGGGVTAERTVPGCFVFVDVQADDSGRALRWVEAAFSALRARSDPVPGLIAMHFHLSVDGARVLIYSEWRSELDYFTALSMNSGLHPGQGCGLTPVSINTYRHCGGLSRPRHGLLEQIR